MTGLESEEAAASCARNPTASVAVTSEVGTCGVQLMRIWQGVWRELREVVWLATVLWCLSIVGVGLAVALALALETWAAAIPSGSGHF